MSPCSPGLQAVDVSIAGVVPHLRTDDDRHRLNAEALAFWERKAEFWDECTGDGNQFQRVLVGPATERLLRLRPGELVLDVAYGNGVRARRLAALGARVVATDFSAALLERARTSDNAKHIEYLVAEATDEAQMLALGT
ncbi:MAG TPA: methyltransferase domain-containing protein [Chloroflexota bacterium]|nr:methyltransferase domain-containing protein [Chloroflexota bacterium]